MDRVEVNTDGILHTRPDGSRNLLLHHELQAVELLNDDEVYFLLLGPNAAVVVPHSAAGGEALLKHLQRLPGFDSSGVVTGLTEPGKRRLWERS